MISDYFSLAVGNLKHRGIRSWLTMLGIFIGIAAVVSLISMGQGLQNAISAQFSSLSTDRLLVTNAETSFGPPGSYAIKKLTEHDLELIDSVSGVKITVSRLIRMAKVEHNRIVQFRYLGSLPDDQEKLDYVYDSFLLEAESGRLLRAGEKGSVIVGSDFKTNNGFDKDIEVGSRITIQGKSFQVAGILKKASTFQINSVVLMSDSDMKELLDIDDEIDAIVVGVDDPKKTEDVAKSIENKLRKDRDEDFGEEDFSVQTPIQALQSVETVLNIINLTVSGIAALSLIIGSIGIANTMFTSVVERTREIGIMKAVGAKNSDILSIFLIESGLLGLIGGIVGALIGLGLAFVASTVANGFFGTELFTVSISWSLILGSIMLSFFLGIISGSIPAYQASRLRPVEALRQ